MQLHKNYMIVACLLLAAFFFAEGSAKAAQGNRPNILFIVMDDVGIDQFKSFGYGGDEPPRTPTMDTVARGGLRFRNVWAMAECSPSRSLIFSGRYPLRTHIYSPIQSADLANSQLSPYEMTVPKVLKRAGYTSVLFGKHHMAGPTNPFGDQAPMSFGFDYFHGPVGGTTAGAMPDPIDATAGGIASGGPYVCGFIPNKDTDPDNGADNGACYFADGSCTVISRSEAEPHPGRACLELGGILVPDAACQADPPANVNFLLANAYYVWYLGETDLETNLIKQIPLTDPRARTYWPTELTTAAIAWINAYQHRPWMVTVAYPSIHAPYQQAPQSLTPGSDDLGGACCSCDADKPTLGDQMLQAMDTEIGRLLVETGLASRTSSGQLKYTPNASNTMIVIVGDNGTYGPSVKSPFDPTRAKGTVFQTGVWVPLIVAGPLVHSPNRKVESMVNVADLFELFGEIAGLDVPQDRPLLTRSRFGLDVALSQTPLAPEPSRVQLRPNRRQHHCQQRKTRPLRTPYLDLRPGEYLCTADGRSESV